MDGRIPGQHRDSCEAGLNTGSSLGGYPNPYHFSCGDRRFPLQREMLSAASTRSTPHPANGGWILQPNPLSAEIAAARYANDLSSVLGNDTTVKYRTPRLLSRPLHAYQLVTRIRGGWMPDRATLVSWSDPMGEFRAVHLRIASWLSSAGKGRSGSEPSGTPAISMRVVIEILTTDQSRITRLIQNFHRRAIMP